MEIKGIKEGILITLEGEDWQEARARLIDKIEEKQAFFQGARLILDVGNAVVGTNALEEIRDCLSKQDIHLFGILSPSQVTQAATQKLGLIYELKKPTPKSEQNLLPLITFLSGETATLINRSIRSGERVAYHGHVVVLGNVKPGAEIVATGSVIVWGRLRGSVHAGAEGDQNAVVCALDLSPMQLRIASKIATTTQDQTDRQPEIASIMDEQVISEPWKY